jgi:glycosyltransferase involved in cell wall biosynthesis
MLPVVYGVIAGKIWRKRIIVTYHGGEAAEYFKKHGAFARRWLNRADKVIVLNGYLKNVFEEYHIPCIVIPNIVPLREDVYRLKQSIAPKMISVRHLTDLYRIDLIIHAFAKVVEKYPEATLDILGQGDMRSELECLAHRDERLEKRVRFMGQVPNEKMYDYLKANDIMLSAPRIDNMPVSLMEAMNAGVLVISSNVGGVPYMISHQQTGLLFDGDVDALAEQIIWALEHKKESVAMIEAAHEEVKKYSWNNIRKQLLPIYE